MTEFLSSNKYNKVKEITEEKSLNSTILEKIQISSQETMLIKSVEKFFCNDDLRINIMLPIINSESNISLRVIDHFITNYSRKNTISYNLTENNNTIIFNVNASYKSQLKAYNKKHFDPFCRGTRIPFFYNKNNCVITTIGQLNFFKWAISKGIIKWVRNNLDLIESDMNKSNKRDSTKIKKSYKSIQVHNKKESNFIDTIQVKSEEKKKVRIYVTFE